MRAGLVRGMAVLSLGAVLVAGGPVGAQSPSPSPSAVPSDAPVVPDIAADPVVACPVPAPAGGAAAPSASIAPAPVRAAPEAKPVGQWSGTWRRMPRSPLSARSGAATDFAEGEGRIYVWGGRDASGALLADGAAYVVEDRAWVTLPDSGLAPRERFAFDSDRRGIVIWGGVDAAGQPLADGARLTFEGRGQVLTWVALPSAPLTPGPASISGDLNGMIAVTPGVSPGDPPLFAILDQTDAGFGWDDPTSPDIQNHGPFTAPPVPPGLAYEVAAVRENGLLLSYQADGTAVGSWFRSGDWTDPFRIDLPASTGCPALDIPTYGWIRADADGTPVGLLTPDGGGRWRALATPPERAVTGGMLVWGPSHLVVADALLAYDLVRERWLRLPEPPDGPRTGVSASWFDGKLYLWGGRSADGTTHADGWMFSPDLPPDTYRLPGGYREDYGDCGGDSDPRSAVFRADAGDRSKVWLELGGERIDTFWPDGYVVRFGNGRAVVVGPDGTVAAREGQRLRDAAKQDYCPGGGGVTF